MENVTNDQDSRLISFRQSAITSAVHHPQWDRDTHWRDYYQHLDPDQQKYVNNLHDPEVLFTDLVDRVSQLLAGSASFPSDWFFMMMADRLWERAFQDRMLLSCGEGIEARLRSWFTDLGVPYRERELKHMVDRYITNTNTNYTMRSKVLTHKDKVRFLNNLPFEPVEHPVEGARPRP